MDKNTEGVSIKREGSLFRNAIKFRLEDAEKVVHKMPRSSFFFRRSNGIPTK